MKKLFALLILVCTLINSNFIVFAEETTDNNKFELFIENAMKNVDNMKVTDKDCLDVTESFINILNYQGLIAAHEFVLENECCIQYKVVDNTETNNRSLVLPTAANLSGSATEYFYQIATESTGRFRKEWIVKLTGAYTYNRVDGTIISASKPVLTLDTANWGIAFSPQLTQITTYRYLDTSTNTISYDASYRMISSFIADDIYTNESLDFGRFDVEFEHSR